MTELLLHRVRRQLETLKLTTAKERLDEHLRRALERELPHLDLLDALLGDELARRRSRAPSRAHESRPLPNARKP